MKQLSHTLRRALAALWLGSHAALAADAPLGLEQALEATANHPRVTQTDAAALPPRPQPLYLDCHSLAYASSLGMDPERNRPNQALIPPLAAQQLEIMQRYLDVLLADLVFARYDEANAVAYIQFDRARERQALGQLSELRVEELNAAFLDVRHKRASGEASQRLTRALLAQAMGHPEELPRDLAPLPSLKLPEKIPELQTILPVARMQNSWLASKMEAAGGERQRLLEMALGQQLLELLLRLQVLNDAGRYAAAETQRRDLELERSRVLYEKELKADLGYSMSAQTRARLREQRVAFCKILAWAELNALLGKPPWPLAE